MPLRMLTCSASIFANGTCHIGACTWGGQRAHPTTVVGLQLGLTFQMTTHTVRPSSRSWPKSFTQMFQRKVERCALIYYCPSTGAPSVEFPKWCYRLWPCLGHRNPGTPWTSKLLLVNCASQSSLQKRRRLWTQTYALPEPPSFRDLGIGTLSSLWSRPTAGCTERKGMWKTCK